MIHLADLAGWFKSKSSLRGKKITKLVEKNLSKQIIKKKYPSFCSGSCNDKTSLKHLWHTFQTFLSHPLIFRKYFCILIHSIPETCSSCDSYHNIEGKKYTQYCDPLNERKNHKKYIWETRAVKLSFLDLLVAARNTWQNQYSLAKRRWNVWKVRNSQYWRTFFWFWKLS